MQPFAPKPVKYSKSVFFSTTKMDAYYLRSVWIVGVIVAAILFLRFVPERRSAINEFRFSEHKAEPAFLLADRTWVDSVLASLTPEQRIAQMIMVAAYSNGNSKNEEEVAELVSKFHIGGLVFFQGSPCNQAILTNRYQAMAKTPLLIAMDAEWGPSMRLDSTVRYPRQMMLGAIDDDRLIFDMGAQIGEQLGRLGVHVNFAPVVDINNNPWNPVIDSRSFGENKINVTRKALFCLFGLSSRGILAVAKHFPGHGDTFTDSHESLPVIAHPRTRLDSLELFPFTELIYNGLPGIMTGHLQVPALDDSRHTPASLSPQVADTLLRKEMGFRGLIFTDALGMKGITNHHKPLETAELAFFAGNDILVMPGDVPGVIAHLAKLICRGKISQNEVDIRCRRILSAKYWAGLNRYKPVDTRNLATDLNKPEYRLLQRKLIESALTVLRNEGRMLPLRRLDTLKLVAVSFGPEEDFTFSGGLDRYAPVTRLHFKCDGMDNTDSLFAELGKYNLAIACIRATDIRSTQSYGINDCMVALMDSVAALIPAVLDLFGNPYTLYRFKNLQKLRALIVSYENSPLVHDISAQLIFGAFGSGGDLPVTPSAWNMGQAGLRLKPLNRLKYTVPLEAGMSEDTLWRIRQIIAIAIQEQAIPGCQVLIARDGKVVMHESFGTHTYGRGPEVHTNDLYDLASITKVAATTLAIMRLKDENCIDVGQKLSAYLPELENTDKNNLLIRDILLHQSGLPAFIPIYPNLLEPIFSRQTLFSNYQSDIYPVKLAPGQFFNRYTRFKSGVVSSFKSSAYPLELASGIFLHRSYLDTVYSSIVRTPLLPKRDYVYSDLGFILFTRLIGSTAQMPMDQYLDSVYYKKLGAYHLLFNPLRKFPAESIAPTEDDMVFRKQLLQGFVHDQRAAMMGGVSGHAGLFGNANDLAKLLQMLLNKGEYGGDVFLKSKTVDQFTGRQLSESTRRGLGFDKPETDPAKPNPVCAEASPSGYGHTGFTGTMCWVDPEYKLVYVFLSNRVHPDASNTKLAEMNIRTDIHQLLYQSILSK